MARINEESRRHERERERGGREDMEDGWMAGMEDIPMDKQTAERGTPIRMVPPPPPPPGPQMDIDWHL